MKEETRFEKRLRQKERDENFLYAKLVTEIGFQLEAALAEEGISQTELARKLGVHKSFVTRVLNGQPNMTLKTLVKFTNALNRFVIPQLGKIGEKSVTKTIGDAEAGESHRGKLQNIS